MSDGPRIPLAKAQELAWEVSSLLSPACTKLCIAGSIRRNRPTCGDLELVAVPILDQIEQHDMFGPVGQIEVDRLHARCVELVHEGTLANRLDKTGQVAFGSRYKRLLYRGFGLDLFAVKDPAQWGVIQLLRTGPALFSKRLVTPVEKGGWLPNGMVCREGALWTLGRRGQVRAGASTDGDWKIQTPTEHDVFAAIGRDYIPPEQREVAP